ncbi:hypothetical protein THAOC_14053 [Thalassiosira oceanica]|uniref:Uncharacterized protein n=1 Tax=Thalassiosira oceanica TaxID=159749 RepID=K0SJL3_THAOC|nr:hypothetical protein THAOC_14053 [Thalassiosira oceanica]|eukprot:EJK65129.1 hypothetical protein THAOC_14053 [Thalassiosira oceanica]
MILSTATASGSVARRRSAARRTSPQCRADGLIETTTRPTAPVSGDIALNPNRFGPSSYRIRSQIISAASPAVFLRRLRRATLSPTWATQRRLCTPTTA